MANRVYVLNYDHYKQNLLEMIHRDYPLDLYTEEQKVMIHSVIDQITSSTEENPFDGYNSLNNKLWKKGVNAIGFDPDEHKVHVRVIKESSPDIETPENSE